MSQKIEIPKSFAICFVGGDKNKTNEQELLLKPLLEKYNIEFWRRCDRFSGFYASFSQIINEACNETNEEFIFFINPSIAYSTDSMSSFGFLRYSRNSRFSLFLSNITVR